MNEMQVTKINHYNTTFIGSSILNTKRNAFKL